MATNDDDDTFARFDVDGDGDLWLWFDQPVQHFRIRRDQAERLYAMLDAEFGRPPVLLGEPVLNLDDIHSDKAYLAYIEPDAPIPTTRYRIFISHSVSVDKELLAKAFTRQ